MTEWWTYGLSDFLMFSPQAYWRLVGRHNAAWWPAQFAGVLASLALPLLARTERTWPHRAALLLLAAAWAWVGWAFHWRHYGEIFLAAPWVAGACGLQAVLLAGAALLPLRGEAAGARARALALVLLAAAGLYPLLAPWTGHGWREAEVFGFMPEPTALASLGVLLLHGGPASARILLALIPALSLLLGAATRWLLAAQ